VFKRSARREPTSTDGATEAARATGNKGRATPKRKEAEARRRTSVVAGATRGSGKGGRAGRPSREELALRREAMRRGDESALGPRDRGPARRFVRDYVDSRRNIAGLFLPVGVPIILLSYTGVPLLTLIGLTTLWAFLVAVVVDAVLLTRRIRREVARRFPGESTKGLGLYALTRSTQFRRMRLPAPRVDRGDRI
jgi:hypothetical protein